MTHSCFATCDMNTIQTGYIKGRLIGENVRLIINDIINLHVAIVQNSPSPHCFPRLGKSL